MNTWTPAATLNKTTCLCRDTGEKGTLPAQHTTFNTLEYIKKKKKKKKNQKGKGPERKGHGPEHVYNTLGYTWLGDLFIERHKIIYTIISLVARQYYVPETTPLSIV